MRTKGSRGAQLFAVAVALSSAIAPAYAQQSPGQAAGGQELSFGVSLGATHSDNILRTSTGEQSDTSANVGVQLQARGRTERLESDVSVNAVQRRYFDDTYPNDLVGGLNGTLRYWFSPQRFGWLIEDTFGQTSVEPRAVETPNNRQNTNFFSTGPELTIGMGERTDLSLNARYSKATYQESGSDDQRYVGTVGIVRRVGRRSSLSLTDTYERIQFTDAASTDYSRNSVSVGFSAQGAHTRLTAQAGYTALYGLGRTLDGPLFNVSIVRDLTQRSSVTLTAGTSFTDSAEAFRRDRRLGGVLLENDPNVVSTDPFQSDFASLVWALRGTRTTITVTGDWRADDHAKLDELNRESLGARFTVARRLSPAFQAVVEGAWRGDDFAESNVKFDEYSGGVGLNWSVSRSIDLSVRGDHFRGSGDSVGPFGSRDYSETRYTLSVSYTPRR